MREVVWALGVFGLLCLGAAVAGMPLVQTLGAGVVLRLLPIAGGLVLGALALRSFFGPKQIDDAIHGNGERIPVNVRAAVIVGGSLILAAIILASGRVI